MGRTGEIQGENKMKKFGFIGMGNMAQAMAEGFITSGKVCAGSIFAYAPNQEKLKNNAERLGFTPCASLKELSESCDTLIMACKPYQIEDVLKELGEGGLKGKNLISVAAGWDFEKYAAHIDCRETAVQYVMPNTPVAVGKGTFLMEETSSMKDEDRIAITDILSALGTVITMPSRLMDAATAVSGCGPAFFDMVIEAIADGAVKNGITRKTAYELACTTMAGTAELMLKTGLHPGELKDRVCSPGGTTIKGVASLEESGIRSAFIKAVDAVLE